jgi:Fe-S-cluster-containing dehydrogenase component
MLIDLEKCIGCNACTMACIKENNLPEGITPNRVLKRRIGDGENAREYFMPLLCMHCENPVCANVCPVKATYKRADGIVVQDNTKCIGCKYCMQACPYRVRMFNKNSPITYKKEHHLGVHVGGTVIKCTFCQHRIDSGNLVTACTQWCPTKARVFGNLNDPNSEISKLIVERNAVQLKEEKLTKPQVYYGLLT